ncbi:MAG: hypothetical protein VKP62_01290 [Candidatus Sericytochromatia bacterium]|nr:hypothetical protein [Candidatus Sericytochromatia bacterium]
MPGNYEAMGSALPSRADMVALLVSAGKRTEQQLAGKTRQQIYQQDYLPAFSKDQVLTTDQVKHMGSKLGWDQGQLDAALNRAQGPGSGFLGIGGSNQEITRGEFTRLVAEMGGNSPKVMLQTLLTDHVTFRQWNFSTLNQRAIRDEAEGQGRALLRTAQDVSKSPAERLQAADALIELSRGYDAATRATGFFPVFKFGDFVNRPPAERTLASMARAAEALKASLGAGAAVPGASGRPATGRFGCARTASWSQAGGNAACRGYPASVGGPAGDPHDHLRPRDRRTQSGGAAGRESRPLVHFHPGPVVVPSGAGGRLAAHLP